MTVPALDEIPDELVRRQDEDDDGLFYRPARLVTHIDDPAIAALRAFYATRLHPGDDVLDLMSSHVSHLPDGPVLGHVVGHGMNAEELAANPRLDRHFVRDLNRTPVLPFTDGSLDVVLCCVGIQYLCRPVTVFAEVRRALRPGGRVLVSFSNRCFPTKAVAAWLDADMPGRARYVRQVLLRAGFPAPVPTVLADGRAGDPLVLIESALF
ncbi:MAG: methyltransferase domain-containing protein [Gluconacetobacter diazotrophicus]|nr:methyltransferase domain-containing protein [Gluconacetobacter diazotrophicus]